MGIVTGLDGQMYDEETGSPMVRQGIGGELVPQASLTANKNYDKWGNLVGYDTPVGYNTADTLQAKFNAAYSGLNDSWMTNAGNFNTGSLSDADKQNLANALGKLPPTLGLGNLGTSQSQAIYELLGPEVAAQYGITPELLNIYNSEIHRGLDKVSEHDKTQERENLAIVLAVALAGYGLASGAAGGTGAGAGGAGAETGFSGTALEGVGGTGGYTGTAAELAADGLGGVDMVGNSGSAAYYDSGAGMWIDSTTGGGIASGAEVPAGYTAEASSSAIAAQDAAAISAEGTGSGGTWDQIKDWYKKGSNAKTVADVLKSFTNSPTQQGSSSYSPLDSAGSDSSSPTSGGVSNSGAGQSQLLETQPQSAGQSYSLPTQQQASGPLGMIDVTPATNTFLQAGSTWNQQMANALRNRNAY